MLIKKICFPCGNKHSKIEQESAVTSQLNRVCDICWDMTTVTSPRNFNYLRWSEYDCSEVQH